jgi:hypothetical protein
VLGRDCCGVENVKETGGEERFGRHQHLPPSCLFYLHSEAFSGAQHGQEKTAVYDDLDNLGVFAPVTVIGHGNSARCSDNENRLDGCISIISSLESESHQHAKREGLLRVSSWSHNSAPRHDLAQACCTGLQGNKEMKEKSWARWGGSRPLAPALISFFSFSSCKAHRALPPKWHNSVGL